MALADLMVVMQAGRIMQADTPREVFERPADAFVARFIGGHNVLPDGGRLVAVRADQCTAAAWFGRAGRGRRAGQGHGWLRWSIRGLWCASPSIMGRADEAVDPGAGHRLPCRTGRGGRAGRFRLVRRPAPTPSHEPRLQEPAMPTIPTRRATVTRRAIVKSAAAAAGVAATFPTGLSHDLGAEHQERHAAPGRHGGVRAEPDRRAGEEGSGLHAEHDGAGHGCGDAEGGDPAAVLRHRRYRVFPVQEDLPDRRAAADGDQEDQGIRQHRADVHHGEADAGHQCRPGHGAVYGQLRAGRRVDQDLRQVASRAAG